MKDPRKKVAYVRGLADGLDLDMSSKGERIISEIIGVLEELADSITSLQQAQSELESYVESIDRDLWDVEEMLNEEMDEAEEDADYQKEEDDSENYIEVECPECHDFVCFDADLLEGDDIIEITCPNCDAVVYTTEQEGEQNRPDGEEKLNELGASHNAEEDI